MPGWAAPSFKNLFLALQQCQAVAMNCLGDGGEGGVETDSGHQSQGGARHKERNIISILKLSQILNFDVS